MTSLTEKEEITHSMAHYLASVHALTEQKRRSRAIDLADYLGVARSTVTLAVRRLKLNGFLEEDGEHNLRLTAKAHDRVHEVLSARALLHTFFVAILGVSPKVANRDACKLESLLSHETQERLFDFLKENLQCPRGDGRTAAASPKVNHCLCDFESLLAFRQLQPSSLEQAEMHCAQPTQKTPTRTSRPDQEE